MMRFTIDVNGQQELNRAFNRISDKTEDLTEAFEAVGGWFKKRMVEQFRTSGAAGSGAWKPLTRKYEERKAQTHPFMPILRRDDLLFKSLAYENEFTVKDIGKREATFGTKAPYARKHQEGAGKLPQRKIIDITDKDRRAIQKVIQRELVPIVRAQGFVMTEENFMDFG